MCGYVGKQCNKIHTMGGNGESRAFFHVGSEMWDLTFAPP
jgi:hypothetical protein